MADPDRDPIQGKGIEEDIKSKRITLADLTAKGSALYAHKKFDEAAEVFSEASNLQASINGETAPENADVLFQYGRSLFRVGQAKSNVLGGAGGAVASKGTASGKGQTESPASLKKHAEASSIGTEKPGDASRPMFQFTGDENFEESDSEDDEANGDDVPEDEDDLSIAFEILDLARVCYNKQLENALAERQAPEDKNRGAVAAQSLILEHIKERLADTHDCLSEISLENEKYHDAIEDGRISLQYKTELYPEDSEIIAEAHFKLSLALEFASVTAAPSTTSADQTEEVDLTLREQAVTEMRRAIQSFNLKLQGAEVDLASVASPEENEAARAAITDMKEVITDMEQRLVDLKSGPVDTKSLLGDAMQPSGVLGAILGESSSAAQTRIEEAKKTATDLSSLIRRKPPASTQDNNNSGKRKAVADSDIPGSPKKSKLEQEGAE